MPFRRLLLPLAALLCLLLPAAAHAAGTPLFPDLITLAPRDLFLDRADVSVDGSGDFHNVLRFSNTVANVGEGPLDMHGSFTTDPNSAPAIQWIYDAAGNVVAKHNVGTFYWHAIHQHYHFDNWGRYELWTKAGWAAYVRAGRPASMQPDIIGTKTTSCVLDDEFVKSLPATPWPAVHPSAGCFPDDNGQMDQGMSVGWGDTYDYFRQEQWIDLGQSTLADGDYVLRSVTDPLNVIYESKNKADRTRESQVANEGVTPFTISGGQLVDTQRPSGTVWVNGVAESTSTTAVTVRVLGRDDVSGVNRVRLSNDGVTWATYPYGGAGTSPMVINWDLADTRYGGSGAGGTRTVYAQVRDATGKWSPTFTDTIDYTAGVGGGGGSSSAYAQTVAADHPVSYWRLDETSGAAAALDQFGRNDLGLRNSPALGAASLLLSDPSDGAISFDGFNQYGTNVTPQGLDPGQYVSVEAWIHPDTVPAAGSFASILTKPESWSLQFNGPRLEWTVIQNGARIRLQAPAGTVVPGQTYHVVGTYDGASQRLYVNGQLVGQTALTGPDDSGDNQVTLASWDGTTEYFDGTLDEAAVYDSLLTGVQVKAHYDAGVATAVGVFPPSNLVASSPDGASVDLGWTDNSNNETGFVVERSTDPSFGSPTSVTIPADTASHHDSGMPAGTYYYRVKSITATYSSNWSNTASITVTGSTASTYPSLVKGDGAAGYWRLDETSGTRAADAAGSDDGTYLGSPTLGATSLIADATGHAVAFDGVDDAVSVPDAAALRPANGVTLEAWVDPVALPAAGNFATVVTKAESYSLEFHGPQMELTIIQNGVRQRLLAPVGAVPIGQVSHVVGTYDGSKQKLFVNGVLVASRAQTGAISVTSNPLVIASWDTLSQRFTGTIDEVAVYKRALSAPQVAAHYAAGRPLAGAGTAAARAARVEPNLRIRRHVGPVKVRPGKDPELTTRRFHGRLVRLVCPMDARPSHRTAAARGR